MKKNLRLFWVSFVGATNLVKAVIYECSDIILFTVKLSY